MDTKGGKANQQTAVWASGLEGQEVVATALSSVDGELGRLIIAGEELGFGDQVLPRGAPGLRFARLWQRLATLGGGEPVSAESLDGKAAAAALGKARFAAATQPAAMAAVASQKDAMAALRAGLGALQVDGLTPEDEGLLIAGAIPVLTAAWWRQQSGVALLRPDANLDHAADTFRLISGRLASQAAAEALDVYLATVSDHGLNASTFTARVVASTGSDLLSSVVAALGALKGPLHGGAPGPVLAMLDEIGSAERAESWLLNELQAGRRIMGLGHRIYRVRDPRAAVFERALRDLGERGLESPHQALAKAVEALATELLAQRYPGRSLQVNVEFYTALLLEAAGVPRPLFSALFAAGRVAGWCAHVAEQRRVGRLIRPQSRYVGSFLDESL